MSAPYLGDFAEDATVHFIWSTNGADGASITRATDGTVSVYKDNGTTQSTAGITDTEDFDSLTGIHVCTIDTSADAFYAAGADYTVVLSAAAIDGQTVNAVLAHFSVENRFDEVNAVLVAGATPDTKADIADSVWTEAIADHSGVAGSTALTVAAILTDTGTTLDGKIDTIDGIVDAIVADTQDIQARLPAALVSGRIDASVGAMAANVLTAAALAADAVAEMADGLLDRNMATGTDSGTATVRTARQALRALRNLVSIAGGTLTVTKEDDSTASWTAAVTTTAGDPISEIDPASA